MRINKALSRKQASALGLAVASVLAAGRAGADTVTFEQNANGQGFTLSDGFMYTFPSNNDWSQSQVLTTDSHGIQYESQPSNWSTPTYPNSSTTNVELAGNTVTLNISVSVDNLDLTAGGALNTLGGTSLNLFSASNNGVITVNSNKANSGTALVFSGGVLSGSGSIVLNDSNNFAQLNGTLTQAAGHAIQGQGEINAALTNSGTVNANVSGSTMFLQTSTMTNSATFMATNGGTLSINGITVTQGTGGQITAAAGSTIDLANAAIVGGTLGSSGSDLVVATGTDTLNNVTSNAAIQIVGGQAINVVGNLVDNGTILVNSNTANSGTAITFSGNSTLSGMGTITLNDSNNFAQLDGTLTQAAGHTIQGEGEINAVLTNSGTVDASVSGQTLYVESSAMTNSATFEATNSGNLAVESNTVTQTSGGQIVAVGAGNTLSFIGATVSGGTISATGGAGMSLNSGVLTGGTVTLGVGGTMTVLGGTNSIQGFTNGGAVNIDGGSTVSIVNGMTDNGSITVNSNKANSGTAITFTGASGTLSGTGTLTLNDGASMAQLNGTLTQGAGHTIQGQGEINAALTNNGTVNANVSGATMYLQTSSMTNSATFMATNGGTLSIDGINVTQTPAGQITAAAGSTIDLASSGIVGGTLGSSGSDLVVATGTDTLNNVTSYAAIQIVGGQAINVVGNLVDNGTILVNSNKANSGTDIAFTGTGGTLSGTGPLTLNDPNNMAQLNGIVTQAATHTIQGQGEINAALTNNGTVNANVSGGTLYLETSSMTNSATFMATNGGTLSVDGITVTQTPAGQITAAAGSTIDLVNSSIVGGTLGSSGSDLVVATGTDTLNNVTSNAAIQLVGGQGISVIGNLIDNGSILVNSNQANSSTAISFNGGTLSGTGTITLNDSNNMAQLNGTLTQAAGHTIQGRGEINAALANNGAVLANVSGKTLLVEGVTTNNNVFQASSGGTLEVTNGDLTNFAGTTLTGGTYEADANSTIKLDPSATAAVTTNAANVILNGAGASFPALNSLATNSGALTIENGASLSTAGSLTNTGTVTVGSPGTPSVGSSGALTVNGLLHVNGSGVVNVTNSLLTINFGNAADPSATIRGYLTTGYNNDTWTGVGIDSSVAATNPGLYAVGYADGNLDQGTPAGANQILVENTLAGDSNLDGIVNFADLLAVAQNFNHTLDTHGNPIDWVDGDFNYDGKVNFADLLLVAQNFNKKLGAGELEQLPGSFQTAWALAEADVAAAQTNNVPEPATAALLALGAGGLLARRRRSGRGAAISS